MRVKVGKNQTQTKTKVNKDSLFIILLSGIFAANLCLRYQITLVKTIKANMIDNNAGTFIYYAKIQYILSFFF